MENHESRYTNLEPLSHGSYGYVYRGLDSETNEYIALKKIRMNLEVSGIPPSVLREISILQELRHPHIVSLRDVIPREDRIFLIFECLHSDLRGLLEQGLPSHRVPVLLQQILKGIHCCHSSRFMHRDIKPENILIDFAGNAKIADFGLARSVQMPGKPYTQDVQTLWYRAPEVLAEINQYNYAIDIWSVGCIFAEMILGRPVFQGASPIGQWIEICKVRGTPNQHNWPGIAQFADISNPFPVLDLQTLLGPLDTDTIDLLESMLQMNPAHRITAKRALEHPYFNRVLN